jgi:hypothetical protein
MEWDLIADAGFLAFEPSGQARLVAVDQPAPAALPVAGVDAIARPAVAGSGARHTACSCSPIGANLTYDTALRVRVVGACRRERRVAEAAIGRRIIDLVFARAGAVNADSDPLRVNRAGKRVDLPERAAVAGECLVRHGPTLSADAGLARRTAPGTTLAAAAVVATDLAGAIRGATCAVPIADVRGVRTAAARRTDHAARTDARPVRTRLSSRAGRTRRPVVAAGDRARAPLAGRAVATARWTTLPVADARPVDAVLTGLARRVAGSAMLVVALQIGAAVGAKNRARRTAGAVPIAALAAAALAGACAREPFPLAGAAGLAVRPDGPEAAAAFRARRRMMLALPALSLRVRGLARGRQETAFADAQAGGRRRLGHDRCWPEGAGEEEAEGAAAAAGARQRLHERIEAGRLHRFPLSHVARR